MGFDIDFGALQTANPFAAFQQGQSIGRQRQQQQTQMTAGNLFARDPDAAAAALASGGDIEGAARVQQLGAGQKQAASRARAKQLIASGNVDGARQEAFGDPELTNQINAMDDRAKATLHEHESAIAAIGYSLNGLTYDQAKAQLQKIAQNPPAGMKPEEILAFEPTPENIRARVGQALGVAKMIELGKPQEIDSTKNLYVSDLFGGASPGATPQPASAPAQTQATAPAGGNQPRGVRNNNPLNVTNLGGGQTWNGQTGADGNYAVFATPEAGFAAADKNLTAYATKHGINTISGVIGRWAPPNENNTPTYIKTVAQDLGVDPNQPLNLTDPNVRRAVLTSMAKVELGQPMPQGDAQPYQVASTGATPPPPSVPGYHLVQAGTPKPVEKWTPDGKGNLINVNGDRKVDPTFDGPGGADPNIVKLVLDGRYPVPTGRAATDPKWQAVLQAAAAQDPTFDASDYHARYATRKDFASGKAAATRTALNTALGHAGDLDTQVDGLHNLPVRALNSVGNVFANETGDPRIKTFNLTKEALMHEALKVFSGSAGSLQEFAQLADTLNVNDSPAQQHSVVKKLVGLLASKMDALGEQYRTGMGKEATASQIMSPHAAAIFEKITGTPLPYETGGDEGASSSGAGSAGKGARAGTSSPVRVNSPQEAMRLAPGTVFITPDGRRKVR